MTIVVSASALGVLIRTWGRQVGDAQFMMQRLEDSRAGSERGRLLAQRRSKALARTIRHSIEVTGISMMVSAQGADHTTGNIPMEELVAASLGICGCCSATADRKTQRIHHGAQDGALRRAKEQSQPGALHWRHSVVLIMP